MARVKARDTAPELAVRRILTRLGYRYRLHRADLPGTPDIAFIGRKKAIFIHGCFWHGHDCPRGSRAPKANAEYWRSKIARNRERDSAVRGRLSEAGWDSRIVWECELRDDAGVAQELMTWLEGGNPVAESH